MQAPFDKMRTSEEESDIGEKHVPVINIEEGDKIKINVKTGSKEHPSETEHFIQWIEILDNKIPISRIYLTHFNKPEATFILKEKPSKLTVRNFCNKHRIWEYSE